KNAVDEVVTKPPSSVARLVACSTAVSKDPLTFTCSSAVRTICGPVGATRDAAPVGGRDAVGAPVAAEADPPPVAAPPALAAADFSSLMAWAATVVDTPMARLRAAPIACAFVGAFAVAAG